MRSALARSNSITLSFCNRWPMPPNMSSTMRSVSFSALRRLGSRVTSYCWSEKSARSRSRIEDWLIGDLVMGVLMRLGGTSLGDRDWDVAGDLERGGRTDGGRVDGW